MKTISLVKRDIKRARVKRLAKLKKRDYSTWVFGEWFGDRCCDNCFYFANYMAKRRPDYSYYWIAGRGLDTTGLDRSITSIEMDSPLAKKVLYRAGVAVYNQGLLDFSTDRGYYTAGAININLWHGVPWKHLGLDVDPNVGIIRKNYRVQMMKSRRAELYLVLSPEFEKVFRRAYLATEERYIRTGYPRNACFYQEDSLVRARKKVLKSIGVENSDSVVVIAYMPTFRDSGSKAFSFTSMALKSDLESLLEEHNAIIVEKSHYVDEKAGNVSFEKESSRVVNLKGASAQELLCAADMLVTDFSSCFFDYLLKDQPIVHYFYDFEEYLANSRGLYYDPEDVVCGDVAITEGELLECIKCNLRFPRKNSELRRMRKEKYLAYESEDSCEMIYQRIMKEISNRS